MLALLLYSGGPRPYAAAGLGEVSVFAFFGLVATCGTAYVQQQRLDATVLWLAAPVGLLACALLMANNLRDIPTDAAAGKRTLAVRLGAQRSRVAAHRDRRHRARAAIARRPVSRASGAGGADAGDRPARGVPLRTAWSATGRALIPTLVGLTRLELVFGVVLAGALLAS